MIVTDAKPADKLASQMAQLADVPVTWQLGGHDLASFTSADLVVMSPGVPTLPEMVAARAAGVELPQAKLPGTPPKLADAVEMIGLALDGGKRLNMADVVKAVLAARMDSEPGTAFAYSTGVSHVMGAILERVTDATGGRVVLAKVNVDENPDSPAVLGVRGIPKWESLLIYLSGFVLTVTPGKVGEVFKSYVLHKRHLVPVVRTAPIVETSDFYQAAVDRRAVRPGTMFYDPNGHVVVLYEILADGAALFFDGHPDGSLTHGTLSEKNVRGGLSQGGGLKNFRPVRLQDGGVVQQRNVELSDYGGAAQFERSFGHCRLPLCNRQRGHTTTDELWCERPSCYKSDQSWQLTQGCKVGCFKLSGDGRTVLRAAKIGRAHV